MEYFVSEKNGNAIQKAIDLAASAGGGKVTLEPGVYPSGTIRLKSNIELHIPAGAVILGFPDPEKYDDFRHPGLDSVTPENSRKCLIACADCENVSITGRGEINGQGCLFFDQNVPAGTPFEKPSWPRPRMIQFFRCRNLLFEGVSFIDSPNWTFWLSGCEDVRISRIRISGCKQICNNDGIDIDEKVPFSVWIDLWFENHKENISATTAEGYKYTIRLLKSYFGIRPINEIRVMDVDI